MNTVVKMIMKYCQVFCKFMVKDRYQNFSLEEYEIVVYLTNLCVNWAFFGMPHEWASLKRE
jgi:hypothetical protein